MSFRIVKLGRIGKMRVVKVIPLARKSQGEVEEQKPGDNHHSTS